MELILVISLQTQEIIKDQCASAVRGVNAGGQTPSKINVIEFVTIASTGNATDFGDLTQKRRFLQGCSDVHGGIG